MQLYSHPVHFYCRLRTPFSILSAGCGTVFHLSSLDSAGAGDGDGHTGIQPATAASRRPFYSALASFLHTIASTTFVPCTLNTARAEANATGLSRRRTDNFQNILSLFHPYPVRPPFALSPVSTICILTLLLSPLQYRYAVRTTFLSLFHVIRFNIV